MPILLFNAYWMTFNSFLAILAVLFGYFFIRTPHPALKVIFGVLWVLFLPNTIYIFTDLQHVIEQWNKVSIGEGFILAIQYILLEIVGLFTFILGFHPFERILNAFHELKKKKVQLIIAFNFFIAFGMVLGRVERLNSWDVFANPVNVLLSTIRVLTSVELLALTFLFGLVCNFIYFLARDFIFQKSKKWLRKTSGIALKLLD